jgi:hypothetical protein
VFGCQLSLPAPLAELPLATVEPDERWLVLAATGRGEEALAMAEAAHGARAPVWGLRAALSAFALGRPDDAEQWVQRALDDGFAGPEGVFAGQVMAPLRRTPALRALRRRTG